jgi:hypothetical protein
VALSARVRWSTLRSGSYEYDYVTQGHLDHRARGVRLACLPDLDGDGTRESVVAIIYPHKQGPEDGGFTYTFEVTFLVSGKSPNWRAVAPLAISGNAPGVEGTRGAQIEVVPIEGGRWALAVRTSIVACGEEDCESQKFHHYTLTNGRLMQTAHPAGK